MTRPVHTSGRTAAGQDTTTRDQTDHPARPPTKRIKASACRAPLHRYVRDAVNYTAK